MFKKLLVPSLVLAMSAFAGVGCKDHSGDATPFVDGGDASSDSVSTVDTGTDAPATDAPATDAPATDASDAASTEGGGDATSDANHG